MPNNNHIDDPLNRELDEALAKYAAVEPRAGLEERILANLRAEPARAPEHGWWRWSVAAALTAVVIIALAVAWRSFQTAPALVEHNPSSTKPSSPQQAQVVSIGEEKAPLQKPRPAHKTTRPAHPAVVAAALPKLDQFPSPQPLSEQEKILAKYVNEHPRQAVLVARARMAALKEDLAEELAAQLAERSGNSDQTVSNPPAN